MEALAKELEKKSQGHRLGWERIRGTFLVENIRKVMDKLQRQCQSFNRLISIDTIALAAITSNEIKEVRKEQKEWHDDVESRKILTWLSQVSFDDRQNDLFSRRHPGTAEWLMEMDDFIAWRDSGHRHSQNLWCPGIRKYIVAASISIQKLT
jgi:hypothetical protein